MNVRPARSLAVFLCLVLLPAAGWPADPDRGAQLVLLQKSRWSGGAMTIYPDGSMVGKAPCNSFGGSYKADASHIALSIRVTRKACYPPGVMQRERDFFAKLNRVRTWRILVRPGMDFQPLILSDEKGEELFILHRDG